MRQPYSWLEKFWKILYEQFSQGKLPHALLLEGAEGCGKWDFVNLFSQFILCENPSYTACGKCKSCQLFEKGHHPDFMVIQPEEDTRSIKINQIRLLSDYLNQTAQRQSYQIALIYPAELMNRAASNALLKTLEEPAGRVIIILICHQVALLPPTILSRCQRHYLSAEPKAAIQWLNEQSKETSWPLLLKISDFAPLKALEFSQANVLTLRDHVIRCFLKLAKNELSPLKPVEYFIKQNVELVVRLMLMLWRDIAWLHLGLREEVIYDDRKEQLLKLQSLFPLEVTMGLLKATQEVWVKIHSPNNLNAQLLLECLLITITDKRMVYTARHSRGEVEL